MFHYWDRAISEYFPHPASDSWCVHTLTPSDNRNHSPRARTLRPAALESRLRPAPDIWNTLAELKCQADRPARPFPCRGCTAPPRRQRHPRRIRHLRCSGCECFASARELPRRTWGGGCDGSSTCASGPGSHSLFG